MVSAPPEVEAPQVLTRNRRSLTRTMQVSGTRLHDAQPAMLSLPPLQTMRATPAAFVFIVFPHPSIATAVRLSRLIIWYGCIFRMRQGDISFTCRIFVEKVLRLRMSRQRSNRPMWTRAEPFHHSFLDHFMWIWPQMLRLVHLPSRSILKRLPPYRPMPCPGRTVFGRRRVCYHHSHHPPNYVRCGGECVRLLQGHHCVAIALLTWGCLCGVRRSSSRPSTAGCHSPAHHRHQAA